MPPIGQLKWWIWMGKLCRRATSFAKHVRLVSLKHKFKREDVQVLSQRSHSTARLPLCMLLFSTLVLSLSTISSAQHIGEQAEMNRLEEQAADLAGQDDPDGAALAIGKAAMMAKIVAQQQGERPVRSLLESVGIFFRGQEYAYRALAIFQQTGGQPPAPRGVCQFLEQAGELMTQSDLSLTKITNLKPPADSSHQRYTTQLDQWKIILPEITDDLAC